MNVDLKKLLAKQSVNTTVWVIYNFIMLSSFAKFVQGWVVPPWLIAVLFFVSILVGMFAFIDTVAKLSMLINQIIKKGK